MITYKTDYKLKISKYWFFAVLVIPAFLTYRSDLAFVYSGWHLLQIPVAALAVLVYIVKYRFDEPIVNAILCYYVIACISCFENGYSPNTIKWDIAGDVGIAIVAYLLMRKNQRVFIKYASKIFFIYLLINTIVMFVWPIGIASGRIGQIVWFLGGKNNIIPWILIGGGCLTLDSFERYGKITRKTYLKLAICSIQAFFCDSSTAVVMLVILGVAYIVNAIVNNQRIMNYLIGKKRILFIVAATFVFVIFFTTQSTILQSLSEWFGKDITFNGRTAIWAIALQYIISSPLIGAGPVLTFDMGWVVNMTHAHCLYLNVCAHYGIIALLCLLFIIWRALKNSKVIPINVYINFFLYLVGSIVEVYSLNTLLLFCILLGCYDEKNRTK